MFKPTLFAQTQQPKVLCLGAHPDDIEIGCGGTLLRILEVPKAEFYWVVFSGQNPRRVEAIRSAETLLEGAIFKIIVKEFRDSYFPFIGEKIKDYFEEIKQNFKPNIIFTHCSNDLHQDHRLISNLTWNTFRDNLILEYEIPKYDGDLSVPNMYLPISDSDVDKKIHLILDSFPSQKTKEWFSEETFRAILRIRGIESNSPSKYAEAFYCRKLVFRIL
jgi:LmbE family N-acetylglucosaminyl deacetylase